STWLRCAATAAWWTAVTSTTLSTASCKPTDHNNREGADTSWCLPPPLVPNPPVGLGARGGDGGDGGARGWYRRGQHTDGQHCDRRLAGYVHCRVGWAFGGNLHRI